jgi:iron complex outermembrane receptor protein
LERVEHDSSVSGQQDQSYSLFSTSLGLLSGEKGQLQWSTLIDYSERAPSIEELYSNGPHLATETFEIGDQNLDTESAIGLTTSVQRQTDAYSFGISAYLNKFSDFIYLSGTGAEEDGLPVFTYQQHDATIWGFDISGDFVVFSTNNGDLTLGAAYEQVSAELDEGPAKYLPRTPGDRSSLSLSWQGDVWYAKLRYEYVAEQDKVAPMELNTDSYEDINLYIERSFALSSGDLSIYLKGKNLSDDEQREHTSFIKDIAPAPGRSWYAGLRYKF